MNILSNIDEIANLIIRPSRYTYKSSDLGNKTFKIQQKLVTRNDFQIKNQNNLKIKGSIYSACQPITQSEQILIYLHCNSGCRIQGLTYMKMAIEYNFTYIVFDFSGSGISQGKFVSLGFYQTLDLQCIYNYIRENISSRAKIVLWGRSMGAVTGNSFILIIQALNFLLKRKFQIALAVLDSPFRSLRDLFIQIGKQKTNFPDFILEMAYKYLKPIIQQKAKFNIEDVDLKIQNNLIKYPGIFIASKQDSLVPFHQIEEIFSHYKGEKQMLFIEQGHNEPRNFKTIKDVFKTIRKYLNSQEILKKDKKSYFNYLPERKQMSKKKLQLTIKSLSQRQLITGKTFRQNTQQQIIKKQLHRQSIKVFLDKKQISCLLPHKKSLKAFQIPEEQQKKSIIMNKSESKLKIKRKPFQIKNFFGEIDQPSQLPQTNRQQNPLKYQTMKRIKILGEQSQISQPHSDIKNENTHINKININTNIGIKQQQFLKRCESLQKVDKVLNDLTDTLNKQVSIKPTFKNKINIHTPININLTKLSDKNHDKCEQTYNNQQSSTYREIKCTQRVLEKIIQKQEKKQLTLNIKKYPFSSSNSQNIQNYSLNIGKQAVNQHFISNSNNINDENKPPHILEQRISKQRKTLQHIVSKKPPFVQLKGVKNYRNSFQSKGSKHKSEIRK